MPDDHPDPLAELLELCTVRIENNGRLGTGFFVAPGYILTCAHVIAETHAEQQKIPFTWKGRGDHALLERLAPDPYPHDDIFPDIALLSTGLLDTPYALLSPSYRTGDKLYSFGYSGLRPGGESLSADCEGKARYDDTSPERELIKFKGTQVLPGISGSPLLNRRTGAVCGIIKRTRGDQGDLGGSRYGWSLSWKRSQNWWPHLHAFQTRILFGARPSDSQVSVGSARSGQIDPCWTLYSLNRQNFRSSFPPRETKVKT